MAGAKEEAIAGWRLELEVPGSALAVFSAALEPFGKALATVELAGTGDWRIELFAAEPPDPAGLGLALDLAAAASGLAAPAPTILAVPVMNWVEATYRAFPPFRLGRFFIHGSHWRGAAPPGSVALAIDAATAFGSGEHATTRGCLLALDGIARRRRVRRVLDLGCGTGILGLAAARIWRRPVLGVDIDPLAVLRAAANARANGLHPWFRARLSRGFANPEIARAGPYDLILANVLARPLMEMARAMALALAPGGTAVLSGLLAGQAAQVLEAYRRQRLKLEQPIEIQGWSTLIVRRGAAGSHIISLPSPHSTSAPASGS